jgi:hypothetical protein
MWWRILVPSWRFFDRVGIHPQLFVRTQGDWVLAVTQPRLRWYSLFFNPQYNYYHACNNLLERLILELVENVDNIETLVSYQLVKNLARQFASDRLSFFGPIDFKITIQGQDVLIGSAREVAA